MYSCCGKTSLGRRLSEILGWPFVDGDDLHPPENIDKMAAGIPLEDEDRRSWLVSLGKLVNEYLKAGHSLLLACSALKQNYRDQLSAGNSRITFVHLKGEYDLIYNRMTTRSNHYMKAEMLLSQFKDLEEPAGALIIDITRDLNAITKEIITALRLDSTIVE